MTGMLAALIARGVIGDADVLAWDVRDAKGAAF